MMSRLLVFSLALCALSPAVLQAQAPPLPVDLSRPRVATDVPPPPRGLSAPRPSEFSPPITYNIQTAPAAPTVVQTPVPVGGGFGGWGGGWGWGRMVTPYEGYLQGLASVTAATGQYHKDIQEARITRYQANEAGLDFARQRIQFERDYEAGKWRAYREDLEGEKRTALDRARRDPSNTEIWNGTAFNQLLRSILSTTRPTAGPDIPVESRVVNGLNFSDKVSRGDVSMAKDEGRIEWTEALLGKAFDDVRDPFNKHFTSAVSAIRTGTSPDRELMAALRSDLRNLEDTLSREVGNLSPGEFTSSRRVINQLKTTVTGLGQPQLARQFAGGRSDLRTVADIISHCMKNGLEFGPAMATNDRQAYSAFYFSLRNYERALMGIASR